jgi:hypothetical protein
MSTTTEVDKSIEKARGIKYPTKKRPPQRGAVTSLMSREKPGV